MHYDKGPQLTVGRLKEYLACIPDDVKICIGIGNEVAELHYLLNQNDNLVLHPDCYMQNASKMLCWSGRKKEYETISWYNEKMGHVTGHVGNTDSSGKAEAYKKVIDKLNSL